MPHCQYACSTVNTHAPPSIHPSCCQHTCNPVNMAAPSSICPFPCCCCGLQCWRWHIRGCECPHLSMRGEAKRWPGDTASSCVGDAIAVAVAAVMLVSTCLTWPKVSIPHGFDRVVVGTWGWGWCWEWEEMMGQFPTGSSQRWQELHSYKVNLPSACCN